MSGARIVNRPVIRELLDEIYKGKYDGVTVVKYDRLSRGSQKDHGEIIERCQWSNTYIITPERIFDPNNTQDLQVLEIQGFIGNTELRIITERLVEGKQDGVREGKLTNGEPPYPYFKKRGVGKDKKGRPRIIFDIVVDPVKKKIYDEMKEMYLSGKYGTQSIAIHLNKQGYESPGKNKKTGNPGEWSSTAVQRLLLHEFHMGYVTYGKYEWKKDIEGNRKLVRKRDEEELFKNDENKLGNWTYLKTQEEHQRILEIMQRNTKIPKKSRRGTFPTSGLMYCKKCGYSMGYSIGRVEAKTGKKYDYTKCTYQRATVEKCTQKGIKMTEEFFEAIYQAVITSHLNEELIEKSQQNKEEIEEKRNELVELQKVYKKKEGELDRVNAGYRAGAYTVEEFKKEKAFVNNEIDKIKKEIKKVEDVIFNATTYTKEELEKRIKVFKKGWIKANTAEEQNAILKTILKCIFYDRNGETVKLEVEYL